MPRHPPGGETISLVVPPRGFVETRRNSSSERKKSHEAMRLCRSLAIGACSCWVRRGGLQPHSLAWGSPRPKDAGKSPRQISGGWGGRNEQAFCCLMLVFTPSWSCMCAAGQVWKGLLRGRMNHAEEDRKSPVLVPCILRGMLLVILFLQRSI